MIISADYDGLYKDDEGNRQYLSSAVLVAIRWMKINEKVLILKEIKGRKEMHVWSVYLLSLRPLLT